MAVPCPIHPCHHYVLQCQCLAKGFYNVLHLYGLHLTLQMVHLTTLLSVAPSLASFRYLLAREDINDRRPSDDIPSSVTSCITHSRSVAPSLAPRQYHTGVKIISRLQKAATQVPQVAPPTHALLPHAGTSSVSHRCLDYR